MQVIAVASTKGGTGKTMLALQLGALSAESKLRTLVIDSDSQMSAMIFSKLSKVPGLTIKAHRKGALQPILTGLIGQYDRVFIDVGGFDGTLFRSALISADLAIIPTSVGPPDIWALSQQTLVALREVSKYRATPLKTRLVINRYRPNTRLSKSVAEALQKLSDEFPLFSTVMQTRDAYAISLSQGLGVTQYDRASKAALELQNLYGEMEAALASDT